MNKQDIQAKLNIFETSNFIDEKQKKKCEKILNLLEEYDPTHIDTFITHMVMSLKRKRDNENIDMLDLFLIEELENNKNILKCSELYTEIIKILDIELLENEIWYYKLHLLNLINNKEDLWRE